MSRKPKRFVLPFDQWPPDHQSAWQAAMNPGDVFSAMGQAARWTEKTRRQAVKDYGMWLKHRADQGQTLSESDPPSLSKENLRPFVAELQERLAPMTVCSRLRGLSEAYRVMWPGEDRTVLRKLLSRLKRNATPSRNKQALLLSSREILNGALSHLETVIKDPAPSETIRACWVRNAVMVALLAIHPIRLANLTHIQLGQHLKKEGDEIWLRFTEYETKEKRRMEFPLAPTLAEPLQLYLDIYRLTLLDTNESDALWISVRKGPMAETAVYEQIVKTTDQLFGHPINPHLFRDCAMTTLATEDPAHVRVGARLLGHSSLKTGEQNYNQATMLSAVAQYHETLAQLRGTESPLEEITP